MEIEFRVAVFILGAGAALIAFGFRRRDEPSSIGPIKEQAKKEEQSNCKRWVASVGQKRVWLDVLLSISAFALAFATMGFVFFPRSISWGSLGAPTWVRWSGVGFGMIGLALMAWSLGTLGRNYTPTVITRDEGTLVRSGPYRWVRHPYYLATMFIVIATTLLSANLLVGGLGLCMVIVLIVRTPIEEMYLLNRFGREYADYQQHVGAFLPRFPFR